MKVLLTDTMRLPFRRLFLRQFNLLVISLLVLLCCAQTKLSALESIPSQASYPQPADLSQLHFYLITVDVGENVWDNFGHTALRVFDENNGSDTVFNWGGFDTSGGVVAFSYNFFKGIMNYTLFTSTPTREFDSFRNQQRTVWQDKLNLSNQQKEVLYRRLMWNLEPDNVIYAYHHFFDNCTTRIRDYLDEALSGKLARQFTGVTDHSFRDLVEAHYASVALIGFSLDVLVNSNVDRPVSEWEQMFLPLSLRSQLAQIQSDVVINGERLALLSDSQVIMEFAPPMVETDVYRVASLVLLAPILLLSLLLKKIPMSYFATHSRVSLKAPGFSFMMLGLLGLLTATFSGIYGTLMLGSWFFSEHLDLHHNINLLLFWPTDLLGIIVSIRWLVLRSPWPMTNNSTPFINYYLLAHVIGMLGYGFIALMGLSNQSIDRIALYVLPGFFCFTLFVWLVGFVQAKPRNMYF